MAHDIALINGRPAMSYINDTPWHGLGTVMTEAISRDVDAALISANLNWKVELRDHLLADGRKSPFSNAVVRDVDNAILASVGAGTRLVQNREALGIIEPLVKDFGAHIETAGALGQGERIWALVRMPETVTPAGLPNDNHDGYLLIRHAHDNTHLLEAIPTLIRVVCKNTMMMAVAGAGGEQSKSGRLFRIRKTVNVSDRVNDAKQLVARMGEVMKETGETLGAMAARQVTPQEVAELIESVFPLPLVNGKVQDSKTITERRKTVAQAVFTQPGAEMAGSNLATGATTAYAVVNAISYYFDHLRPREAKSKTAEAKANESAIFGGNAAIKLLALAKARQLVKVAA